MGNLDRLEHFKQPKLSRLPCSTLDLHVIGTACSQAMSVDHTSWGHVSCEETMSFVAAVQSLDLTPGQCLRSVDFWLLWVANGIASGAGLTLLNNLGQQARRCNIGTTCCDSDRTSSKPCLDHRLVSIWCSSCSCKVTPSRCMGDE